MLSGTTLRANENARRTVIVSVRHKFPGLTHIGLEQLLAIY